MRSWIGAFLRYLLDCAGADLLFDPHRFLSALRLALFYTPKAATRLQELTEGKAKRSRTSSAGTPSRTFLMHATHLLGTNRSRPPSSLALARSVPLATFALPSSADSARRPDIPFARRSDLPAQQQQSRKRWQRCASYAGTAERSPLDGPGDAQFAITAGVPYSAITERTLPSVSPPSRRLSPSCTHSSTSSGSSTEPASPASPRPPLALPPDAQPLPVPSLALSPLLLTLPTLDHFPPDSGLPLPLGLLALRHPLPLASLRAGEPLR